MPLNHNEEVNLHALRLALDYYRGTGASDTDIELKADKFKRYLATGRMSR